MHTSQFDTRTVKFAHPSARGEGPGTERHEVNFNKTRLGCVVTSLRSHLPDKSLTEFLRAALCAERYWHGHASITKQNRNLGFQIVHKVLNRHWCRNPQQKILQLPARGSGATKAILSTGNNGAHRRGQCDFAR